MIYSKDDVCFCIEGLGWVIGGVVSIVNSRLIDTRVLQSCETNFIRPVLDAFDSLKFFSIGCIEVNSDKLNVVSYRLTKVAY